MSNDKFKLSESVEYSNGSVVSKIIIDKKSGTVTLFAFDEGQKLSEHTASFDALVQVLDGEVEIIINKESFLLNQNEVIVMPANIPHAINAVKKFKMLLTMLKE